MTPTRKLLLLVAAGLAPLTLAGLAAAVEGGDDATQTEVTAADATAATPEATCPDDADDQSTVVDTTDADDESSEVDATEADDEAVEVDAADDQADDEADDCEAPEVADSTPAPADEPVADAGTHPENHGFFVSEAAKSCPAGPEHGPCVRAVAQSDAGKPDHGPDAAADVTDEPDTSDAAVEQGGDAPAAHGHAAGAAKGKSPKH